MMRTLYITSTDDYAGKTALAIGLGKHLQRDGYVVGYMKPFTTRAEQAEGQATVQDTDFLRQELGLSESREDIMPLALTPKRIEEAIQSPQDTDFVAQLQAAYDRVAVDKDVVILEGEGCPFQGAMFDLSSPQVAEQFDAQVLAVIKYEDNLSIDEAAGLRMIYGDRLIGTVINSVPRSHRRFVEQLASPALEARNTPVFAVLPEERLLSSISVRELAERLGGEIVCCEGELEALVEYLMVGAMTAGSAITYFRRRPNKAVITGGDRADVQLAALETSTRCLILTGGQHPSTVVMSRAQEVGVPIIVAEPDTLTTVQTIQQFFGKTSLHQAKKSAHFGNILEERFDFARFYTVLGLKA
jgi:BioD-like phosphotransacetylase family protein